MIYHERDNMMAENDINNEEQYKIAADRLIKYYDENRDKLKINVANNDLYKNFYEKYNLDILSSLTPEQFMKEILFNKGNDDNKDLCHQLEFGLYKSCGLISNPGGVYRYYIHNTNNGWIVGYKGKTAIKVSFEEAKNIAINLKEKILKGGECILKRINQDKLNSINDYDNLDYEITNALTDKFKNLLWVRKYYHMLFPQKIANWFTIDSQSSILKELNIEPAKTFYGRSGQLIKIYSYTNYDCFTNMMICDSINNMANKKKEINKNNEIKSIDQQGEDQSIFIKQNQILYGPPGTGKTYNTVIEAMRIINPNLIDEYEKNQKNYDEVKEEFDKAKKEGRIEFITFHQSYSYEEFVEGIKPDLSDEWGNSSENLTYKGTDGVFKIIANRALFDRLEIKEDKKNKILNFGYIKDKFIEKYQVGDELETIKSKSKFKIEKYTEDSIRIRPSNSEYIYSVSYNYLEEAFNKNLKKDEDIVNIIGMPKGLTSYYRSIYCELIDLYNIEIKNRKGKENNRISTNEEISNEQKRRLVKEYYENKLSLKEDINESEKYVLIIDEINRGNISKIFGELITLIEEDKRESFSVRLPYSHEEFTVPKNLYIIGTMNTSDRSIASIDIALRRRFTFKEMMPDKNRVTEEIKENNTTIKLQNIFNTLNKRISVLLDRDHQIGHSYFMNVKCIDDLKKVWFNSIMPLLNEYFYNDWEKLQALLGKAKLADDNHKYPSFVKKIEKVDFADSDYQCDENEQYDFVSDTEIDFEKALENAFTKQIEYKEKE